MKTVFLDTNIFLRHLLGDSPNQSAKATGIFKSIEEGQLKARISDIVVFETVFTLQRAYNQPKTKIREAVLPLIELPGIVMPGKRRFRRVFDLYINLNLPFADCYFAVLMKQLKIKEIVSFDREFDKIPEIKRIAP